MCHVKKKKGSLLCPLLSHFLQDQQRSKEVAAFGRRRDRLLASFSCVCGRGSRENLHNYLIWRTGLKMEEEEERRKMVVVQRQ